MLSAIEVPAGEAGYSWRRGFWRTRFPNDSMNPVSHGATEQQPPASSRHPARVCGAPYMGNPTILRPRNAALTPRKTRPRSGLSAEGAYRLSSRPHVVMAQARQSLASRAGSAGLATRGGSLRAPALEDDEVFFRAGDFFALVFLDPWTLVALGTGFFALPICAEVFPSTVLRLLRGKSGPFTPCPRDDEQRDR